MQRQIQLMKHNAHKDWIFILFWIRVLMKRLQLNRSNNKQD